MSVLSQNKETNLATKEDIAAITDKIERVRSEYAERLEQTKQSHLLSRAAMDKRLGVHQQAYARCANLWIYLRAREKTCKDAKFDWWSKNYLYLSDKAKAAFLQVIQEIYEDKNLKPV